MMYQSKGKRILDILLAATGLITSLPFFIVLPPLLWAYFKGNPFFVQQRPGLHGRPFKILKFRTMQCDGQPIPRFGRVIRQASLDELPQFWNVLWGDMSIVGPRPLLVEYLPLYNAEQHLRHAVKPGMTGLAQIHGRNSLSWEEKFEYDVAYVRNVSWRLDMLIIYNTVLQMLQIGKPKGGAGIEAVRFKGTPVC
jgi:lipopolysaccharide/colanic/teichoic acid biosynthesis glycosyltransferase